MAKLEITEKRNEFSKKAIAAFKAFQGRFRAFLAFWVVTIAFIYLFAVSFGSVDETAKGFVGPIIGFLTGTALAMVLAFYFSGAEQTDHKSQNAMIERLQQRLKEKDDEIAAKSQTPE